MNVPPQKLIGRLSEELKKNENIKPPEWSKFVKTGVSSERPPLQEDWWFLRSAAVLRKIYLNGPVGVQRLRTAFGGSVLGSVLLIIIAALVAWAITRGK